jgi:hypothetical protein
MLMGEDLEEDSQMEGLERSMDDSGFKSLICPLCMNFLYKCVTAYCGHSFCEKCLDEYLILKRVSSHSLHSN